MTSHWRLRHKLVLGLALVIGTTAILLGGTLFGLSSYFCTMQITDRKLAELHAAENLRKAVALLSATTEPLSQIDELAHLRQQRAIVQTALTIFEQEHQTTLERNRDPDHGFQETGLLDDLRMGLAAFDQALTTALAPRLVGPGDTHWLRDFPAVRSAQERLVLVSDQLRSEIYGDMYRRIDTAKKHYRQSLWMVGGASVLSVFLTALMLHYFYRWMFHPIQALQAGVQRLTAGNFEQPIALNSGCELAELGRAFDAMTARLHALYRDLAQQVNERSRQLVKSERMVSVGFLAAGVAHEINNPLAGILFCSEGLERRLRDYLATAGSEGETVSKYLRMIQTEANRCKTITQKLLDFSRVGEKQRTATDLVELVQGVLEMAQHLQNCHDKRIVFQPAGRINAAVNAQDLKSVILNLVVNALDSMDAGGVLTIRLVQADEQVTLTFSDTGCGMPAEVLENLFEPFFTRNRTGKGTGLGLFITHQIIDQHGGTITARSPGPGLGSTFTVQLPTAGQVAPEQPALRLPTADTSARRAA